MSDLEQLAFNELEEIVVADGQPRALTRVKAIPVWIPQLIQIVASQDAAVRYRRIVDAVLGQKISKSIPADAYMLGPPTYQKGHSGPLNNIPVQFYRKNP